MRGSSLHWKAGRTQPPSNEHWLQPTTGYRAVTKARAHTVDCQKLKHGCRVICAGVPSLFGLRLEGHVPTFRLLWHLGGFRPDGEVCVGIMIIMGLRRDLPSPKTPNRPQGPQIGRNSFSWEFRRGLPSVMAEPPHQQSRETLLKFALLRHLDL